MRPPFLVAQPLYEEGVPPVALIQVLLTAFGAVQVVINVTGGTIVVHWQLAAPFGLMVQPAPVVLVEFVAAHPESWLPQVP